MREILKHQNTRPQRPLRSILNQTYLIMLERYGMSSAIIDAFDEGIKRFASGKREDLKKLVYRILDNEQIDLKSLNKEEVDYIKTTKVLMGQILYSDSWLAM